MARVLFVNPIVRQEDCPRHVPYGIALLAAICERNGDQVAILDCNAHRCGAHKAGEAALADSWDVVAIGGLSTTFNYIKAACKEIRAANPNVLIVAGGGFLTSQPAEMMGWVKEIDVGVVGEAFVTFPEVVREAHTRDFKDMPGIIWRDQGEPVLNEARPVIHDLDTLPHPAWHLFPLEIYFANSSSLFSEDAYLSTRRIDINASYIS